MVFQYQITVKVIDLHVQASPEQFGNMTYHFVQFVIGLSYSFPVVTVDNKYQTLRAKTTDAQTDDKYSEANINCTKPKPTLRYQPELTVSYQHWCDHNVKQRLTTCRSNYS